jgi:tetratricopeptide (TPR) repeat protein
MYVLLNKKRGWLLLFLFMASNAYSQSEYYMKVSEAHGYYYTQEYDKGLSKFEEAFQISKPEERDLIIAAYTAAKLSQSEQALDYLDQYFALNSNIYLDIESIISDSVFDQLRHHSGWKEIIEKAYANNARIEPGLDNDLRTALEELFLLDQQTRDMSIIDSLIAQHGFPSDPVSAYFKKMNAQDEKNLSRFKELVPVGTIPGISKVGVKANLTAWLIIQHSSTAVQKEYLAALKASAEVGESNWGQVAGTIDRIMVEEEGVQLYGTQFGIDENGNGFVKPIRDPQNVNKRREKVGLIALEHDVKRHGITGKENP